jgi:hypothetical protein
MSVNMSMNLSSFSNKFKKAEPAAEEKKNKGAKLNPLLNVKTDLYVDDNEAYKTRISKEDKLQYWTQLLPNRGRRPLPKAFKSWKLKEISSVNEKLNYPWYYLYMFGFIKSVNWDHRCLNLFIVWILLCIFFLDGWAAMVSPQAVSYNAGNQILMLFPLLMAITQAIPFLGTWYFISHCNDLVHFQALQDIGNWVSSPVSNGFVY